MDRRIKIIFGIFCVWFLIIALTLWKVQIVNYERYAELAKRNRTRTVRIPACRGRIYDRYGRILVDNKAARQLVVTAAEVVDSQELANELAKLTDFTPEYIIEKIKENLFRPFVPAVLAEDLSDVTLTKVTENRFLLSGVDVQIRPIRDYLYGPAIAHLIGYVGEVNRKELEEGYNWDDIIGRTGVEQAKDDDLQGEIGFKQVQVDQKGNLDEILGVIKPEPGSDLSLTIDLALQEILYRAMDGQRGAGVVLDPRNGDILAMVSLPSFDPNCFVSPAKPEEVNKIFKNKERPLLNRAIGGLYPPGSVYKIIVALAALEEGIVGPKNIFNCDGKFTLGDTEFKCWAKHGWADLSNALKRSCNEYFYQVGLKLGYQPMVIMAQRFGFGELTGINISGEKAGLLPTVNRAKQPWYHGDTVNLSIGHGYILVTPLQAARMIAAIANGGILYQPQIFRSRQIEKDNKEGVVVDIDPNYISWVKKGLFRVVNEPAGTGYKTHIEELDVAGKTGTVALQEKGRERNICWFVGFAPYDNPEIALAVVIEDGAGGGATAAPVAKQVFLEFKQRKETEQKKALPQRHEDTKK